jgi:hypothetical protein
MLYVEAPAGVGFSYSTNASGYHTGDSQTAADNYNAIQSFFVKSVILFHHLTLLVRMDVVDLTSFSGSTLCVDFLTYSLTISTSPARGEQTRRLARIGIPEFLLTVVLDAFLPF